MLQHRFKTASFRSAEDMLQVRTVLGKTTNQNLFVANQCSQLQAPPKCLRVSLVQVRVKGPFSRGTGPFRVVSACIWPVTSCLLASTRSDALEATSQRILQARVSAAFRFLVVLEIQSWKQQVPFVYNKGSGTRGAPNPDLGDMCSACSIC